MQVLQQFLQLNTLLYHDIAKYVLHIEHYICYKSVVAYLLFRQFNNDLYKLSVLLMKTISCFQTLDM